MKLWQAVVLTTVLGIFTVVFLAGIALIGLQADPSGENNEPPSPAAEEGEGAASAVALGDISIAIA